jgi:hypothetical protein
MAIFSRLSFISANLASRRMVEFLLKRRALLSCGDLRVHQPKDAAFWPQSPVDSGDNSS